MEIWKPVPLFEGFYEASNLGRIKSLRGAGATQRTLTEAQIREVHKFNAEGISARKMAPKFGISSTVISKILRGSAYADTNRILKPAVRKDGYMFVTLSVEGKHFHKTIHSMVIAAFKGSRPPTAQVNHIDGNKLNNCVDNLEYVSPGGNQRHARYELRRVYKLTVEQATDIFYSRQRREKCKNVAAKYGVSVACVQAIRCGRSWWFAR